MINVSSDFKSQMKNNRNFVPTAELTLTDGKTLILTEDELSASNNSIVDGASASTFPIGTAIQKYITLEFLNPDDVYSGYDFFGAKIRYYLDFELEDGTTERVEKGTYTVISPESHDQIISLTAYDDMYKADKIYSTNLIFPQTANTVLREICSTCDINLGSTTFLHDDFIIAKAPTDCTYREVIGYIAMIACGNARIDVSNKLRIISWNFTGWDIDGGYFALDEWNSPTIDYNPSAITGFQTTATAYETDKDGNTTEKDKTLLIGTEDYLIEVENPLIEGSENTVLQWLYDKLAGIRFYPFSGDLISNPLIEFMDLVKCENWLGDYKQSFVTDINFIVDGYTTVQNASPTAETNNTKYNNDASKATAAARKLVEHEKADREQAIDALNKTLSESSGMYVTEETQLDGSTITYLHDKRELSDSNNVIKITSTAIGISNDGGNTYPYGIELDGTFIANLLYAVGINADYITSGSFVVRNDDTVIFSANVDTGRVYIDGDHVIIGGGTTLNEKFNEIEAKSKNMTMQLSNEYQAISVGNDGEYSSFPECTTKPVVMYGSQDITENCSFTFSKSDSVTGHWDSSTKTYTVTGLSADSGWVDIKATYINVLTVVKRFSLSKVYAGNDATADMKTYQLEASANIYKVVEDNLVEPDTITFSAYCRTGEDATLSEYKGRFVIEGTEDGNNWVTLYTSEKDESSAELLSTSFLMYWSTSLVLMYADADDGTFLYTDKPLSECTNVRCKLYAAGGTDTLLDQIVIDKVTDVAALTQEEIFNILTDNGSWKGIYYENGQMYISFTYAKGGTLVLGGADNVNGQLIIRDADGNQIGEWGKDGIVTEKGSFTGTVNAENGKIGGWTITDNTIYNGTEGTFNGTKYIDGVVLHADEPYLQFASTKLKTSRKGALMVDGGFKISLPSRGGFTDGGETNEFVIENLGSTTSGSSMVLDGTWVCYISSSSKRYKDIERDMTEEDINDLYGIQPVIAKYKDDYLKPTDERYQKTMPMFVAEDVEEHFPICANHNKDGTTEDWNMRIMIPAMFQMIKEQKKEIDKLTELVNNLLERSE